MAVERISKTLGENGYTQYVFGNDQSVPPSRAIIETNGDHVAMAGPLTPEQCDRFCAANDTTAEARIEAEGHATFGYSFEDAHDMYVAGEYPGSIDGLAAFAAQLVLASI